MFVCLLRLKGCYGIRVEQRVEVVDWKTEVDNFLRVDIKSLQKWVRELVE